MDKLQELAAESDPDDSQSQEDDEDFKRQESEAADVAVALDEQLAAS